MTRREAKRFVCAWAAAQLNGEGLDNATAKLTDDDQERIDLEAIDLIDELLRRSGCKTVSDAYLLMRRTCKVSP